MSLFVDAFGSNIHRIASEIEDNAHKVIDSNGSQADQARKKLIECASRIPEVDRDAVQACLAADHKGKLFAVGLLNHVPDVRLHYNVDGKVEMIEICPGVLDQHVKKHEVIIKGSARYI